MAPKKKFRFVWIGEGLDKEPDAKYSLYLADQIQRSGLNDVAIILKAVSDMEGAYLESDVLFLSSRLDPLPLVSLEAIHLAKPVVCFESATGIAEYLAQDPVAAFGIVPFLDVEAAARRIFRLIEDSELRLQIGQASKKLANSRFRFDRYVEEIDRIARQCALKKQQEKADRLVISQSNLFDARFFSSPRSPWLARSHPALHQRLFQRHSASEGGSRVFIPESTKNATNSRGVIPWRIIWPTASPRDRGSLTSFRRLRKIRRAVQSLRVGLHLHLYHHEMGKEIFEHLRE